MIKSRDFTVVVPTRTGEGAYPIRAATFAQAAEAFVSSHTSMFPVKPGYKASRFTLMVIGDEGSRALCGITHHANGSVVCTSVFNGMNARSEQVGTPQVDTVVSFDYISRCLGYLHHLMIDGEAFSVSPSDQEVVAFSEKATTTFRHPMRQGQLHG